MTCGTMKSQGITKVSMLNPLGTVKVCTKCNVNLSNGMLVVVIFQSEPKQWTDGLTNCHCVAENMFV